MTIALTLYQIDGEGSNGRLISVGSFTVTDGTVSTLGSFEFTDVDFLYDASVKVTSATSGTISARAYANTGSQTVIKQCTLKYTDPYGVSTTSAAARLYLTTPGKTYDSVSYPRFYITVGEGNSYEVSVSNGRRTGEVVYKGIPTPKPGETTSYVYVNKIAARYLIPNINDFDNFDVTEIQVSPYNTVRVDVRVYLPGVETPIKREMFEYLPEWTYEPRKDLYIRNEPVNGHASKSIQLPFTVSRAGYGGAITVTSGSETYEIATVDAGDNSSFEMITAAPNELPGDTVKVEFRNESVSYDRTYCGDWALYYKNLYGGFDVFLIENNLSKTNNYTRTEYGSSTPVQINYGAGDRGTESYHTDTTSFAFNTGWLSDEESKRFFKHVLSSTYLTLYSVTEEKFYPVNVTNSTAEEKVFANGRRLVSYDVELKYAFTKEIR